MLAGSINFGTNVSNDLPKFTANPNQIYRAAVLHYVDENQQLQPIIRIAQTHFHQVPEGQQGLGGFYCLSTDEVVAPCCKNTGIFGDPLVRIAIPILLYPTTFQGDIIQGGVPDIQVLIVYEKGWSKLNQINKTYPLASNDFTISGKKQGRGTSLDFMPAGPAYWQSEQGMFSQYLGKAKVLVEGPGLTGIDRMLGRKIQLSDVENAIRTASGLPPVVPAPPMVPPVPLMPMGGSYAAPAPVMVAPPVPQLPTPAPVMVAASVPPVAPAAPVAPSGPASPSQLSAIASMLAPQGVQPQE